MSLFQSLAVVAPLNGLKFICGEVSLTSEDQEVLTGLNTVLYAGICMNQPPALTHDRSIVNPSSTAGYVTIESFRPTDATDVTPIVSTVEKDVVWFAVGT